MTPGLLVTAHGDVFRGVSVGAPGVTTGEIVFNTAMTGYQEVLTDPSYSGQVVAMTSSHIGNYGVSSFDAQSSGPRCEGFIVRSMSRKDSNWRSEGTLAAYLQEHGIVALAEVDTRRLTRLIRDRGAMQVAVGSEATESELSDLAANAPSMEGRALALDVSTDQSYQSNTEMASLGHVVAYDFGLKRDILRAFNKRGFDVTVVPADTSAATVLGLGPTGVFLSNGPGDPEPLTGPVAEVRELLGSVPVFGICLGHQILGLALGAKTFKLPFGHHGGNHPVRRLSDGSVEITSQNHGFAVDAWSLSDGQAPGHVGVPGPELLPHVIETDFGPVTPTHQNLNDGTLEGLRCNDIDAFSVQYHPEAAPGPNDAQRLFDEFAADLAGR